MQGNWWGCGHALSWDGEIAVANAAVQGGPCAPSHHNTSFPSMSESSSHKGFYVTPFREVGDPVYDNVTNVTEHGLSINWGPPEFYRQNWDLGFEHWMFGNSNDYVIGVLLAKYPDLHWIDSSTVYLIEWNTNTWYQLIPFENTVHYTRPPNDKGEDGCNNCVSHFKHAIFYFEEDTEVDYHKNRQNQPLVKMNMGKVVSFYTLQGRSMSSINAGKSPYAIIRKSGLRTQKTVNIQRH